MEFSVGIDIEKVSRFKFLGSKHNRLINKIFYKSELILAGNSNNYFQTLTGIWCAKEAVLKAFSAFVDLEITQIEVIKIESKRPSAVIHSDKVEKGIFSLSVSISHTIDYATAIAIVSFK